MSWSTYLVPSEHRRLNELIGLLVLTFGILLALSLISFDPDDPSLNISHGPSFSSRPTNFVGLVGAYGADIVLQVWGYSAFLLPIFLGIYAFYWLASWPVKNFAVRFCGMLFLTVTVATTLGMSTLRLQDSILPGGLIGKILADTLQASFNRTGSAIVLIAALLIALFLSTKFSFTSVIAFLKPRFRLVSEAAEKWMQWQGERARERAAEKAEVKKEKTLRKQTIVTEQAPDPAGRSKAQHATAHSEARREPMVASASEPARPAIFSKRKATATPASTEYPSTALLHASTAAIAINEDELRQRARLIEEKTREFEVEGTVQHIHPGPVVTTFEFKPEPGVKYSRITGLGDDLCLALKAESVRIDRIPGKSTVGMEVPNHERATIVLRELIDSSEYQHSNYRLPLALGKDITGKIVVSDLQKMPHLLAAGSTGTGKSVSINAMILSLLFRCRPDQVKMILIDPKRLELGLYQDIPHLLVPVVTEPKIAQNALKWAVLEMESRYKKLARRGVRNLEAYNEQVKQLPIPGFEEGPPEEADREPLPHIVIVIDELADLMMTAPREVEESITRLAQMARAVGIHLILATQRPSVDVITGLIKANFPARISFRVASKVDSRTILDSNGAEQLLGRGDMLFLPPGSSRLMRVHGPLVTEEEVTRVVDFLKKQGKPTYNDSILQSPEERAEFEETDNGEVDELYDEAVKMVVDMGKASTSVLQRRLRIGYGRAASLLDAMERDGIIGPPDGTKPRTVLVNRDDYLSQQ